MAEFYLTQERAMAPGISGEWPDVIQKPDNVNGRLVRLDGAEDLIIKAVAQLKFMGSEQLAEELKEKFL
jgi:hypothetical protein